MLRASFLQRNFFRVSVSGDLQNEIIEYENEFNADTWTLYAPKTDLIPEFPTSLVPIIVMLLTTVVATAATRKKHRAPDRSY